MSTLTPCEEPIEETLTRNLDNLTPLGFTLWKHLVLNPATERIRSLALSPAHPTARHRAECVCSECVQERILREW